MADFLRILLARQRMRRRLAARVLACFKDVDLTKHEFHVGGVAMTGKGHRTFYAAPEVDIAIDRINALLDELRGVKK